MFCGHLLTVEEMLAQIAKSKRKARSPMTSGSGKEDKTRIVEIRKSRSDKTGTEHIEQKSEKHKDGDSR